MATDKSIVVSQGEPITAAQWRRWEQVGLKQTLDLDELVLNWVNAGVTDLDARGALVSLNLDRTIEGGSTVTMTLADPDGQLFRGRRVRDMRAERRALTPLYRRYPTQVDEGWEPILGPQSISRAMEVKLGGVVFRLVKVRASTSAQTVELTFEDRIVYWLKRKRGQRRATRGSCTRAEFVLSLLQEVQAARGLYRFVCPELHVRQPIAAGARTTSTTTARSVAASDDVPHSLNRVYPAHHIGQPGVRLSERQVRAVAELAGLSPTEALHAAQIAHGESDFYPGVVQNDPGDGMVGYGLWQMTPNAWGGRNNATYRHMQSLGGLSAMRNPIQAARQMKWMRDQAGGWSPWYGTRYLNLSARASKSVLAEGVTPDLAATREGGAGGGTYTKSFQFSRNADENSWTAMQRLAQEVGWRCFVVGNSVYFMSDVQLYGRRVRYELTPDDPAVLDLSFDVDWGKTTSECTLDVVLDRWGAPPGAVVLLDGFGPPDGRWLVTSVSRDYFAPTATVQLAQPGKALLEPANELGTRGSVGSAASGGGETAGDDGTKAGKMYAESKRISDAGGTYVYGGGHGPPLASLSSGQGLDCSSSTSLALFRAGMMPGRVAQVSGWFATSWGRPGRGKRFTVWANSGHVWTQFHGIGSAWRFDTSPYGSGGRGPRLRSTPRPTDGFTPRHWPGC